MDRVAKDADPVDGGSCMVGHDLDMWHPVEVPLEEDPQEPELVDSGDVLWASNGVSVTCTYCAPLCLCAFLL